MAFLEVSLESLVSLDVSLDVSFFSLSVSLASLSVSLVSLGGSFGFWLFLSDSSMAGFAVPLSASFFGDFGSLFLSFASSKPDSIASFFASSSIPSFKGSFAFLGVV